MKLLHLLKKNLNKIHILEKEKIKKKSTLKKVRVQLLHLFRVPHVVVQIQSNIKQRKDKIIEIMEIRIILDHLH